MEEGNEVNEDIGKLISQCLDNPLIQHYFMKKRVMTYDEKELQEKNFGRMIGYCVLFKESVGIEEYMGITSKEQQIQFIQSKIADRIGIPHSEIDERIEEVIEYAFENLVRDGYVFHAGNSNAIENNMKYGLLPSQSSLDERNELMHIASIFGKYSNSNPLGWGILDIKNEKNGWFYNCNPQRMLYYADSPEWFGQLCGGSICYGWGLVPEENRHAYENRDYDACFLNITKLMEKNNMTEDDRKEVLDFFNKCWNKFGDTKPYLALVPINSLKFDDELDEMKDFYLPSKNKDNVFFDKNYIFDDIIEGGCVALDKNVCCNKFVSPDALSCVDLSPILPRFKISDDSKQREITIQDCLRKLNGLDIESLLQAQEFLNQFPSKTNERSL